MCCHTDIEAVDYTCYLTKPQYSDIRPTSPSTEPITPDRVPMIKSTGEGEINLLVSCFGKVLEYLRDWSCSSNMLDYLRGGSALTFICAATLNFKQQIVLAISPSQSIWGDAWCNGKHVCFP